MLRFRILLWAMTLTVMLTYTSLGQDRGFGLGIILGEPTGISFKNWLSRETALDGGLAWSFAGRETTFHLHADYLIHDFRAIRSREKIPIYYGIGGRLKTSRHGDARIGVRGVAGVAFFLESAPIDFFFEVAPILDLAPATELRFNAGVGARYFFE
jgi:hypothetical protein